MRKTVRTTFERVESRRDRRYSAPTIVLRIAEHDYPAINWSLRGILIRAADLALAVGDEFEGTLHLPGTKATYAFSAEVVWTDRDEGKVGAKFTNLAPLAVTALDRLVAQWVSAAR